MAALPAELTTIYLDLGQVEQVVAMPDPLARNVAITHGYHALSEAVASIVGRDHANWLTFGQWASAEARRAIDEESVPAAVRPIFGPEVAESVAAGNAAIFADVAPPFVRFVRTFGFDPRAVEDHDHARGLLAGLLTDPQISGSADLTRAFTAYVDSMLLRGQGAAAASRRAERIFVANVSIGAEEQRVADPYVRAAIPGRWITAIIATSHMGLRLPEGVLELSHDVPRPAYLGGAPFPPDLMELDDEDAVELAARFGQDLHSTRRSGAPDWESYQERMGYIFTLLRAHQCDPSMFQLPPGTPPI
jgi:hypothetical protein